MATSIRDKTGPRPGQQPTWEIAYLFPDQGMWSEEEYLALDTNRLIEFSEGILEVLPMPTTSHQLISAFLYGMVAAFVGPADLGTVIYAALRVRLWKGKFREPDVVFVLREHSRLIKEKYWIGADLVMEVVSADKESRHRDLVTKRREYARARIPEYWIVDPAKRRITVLKLAGKRYVVHGEFAPGDLATSFILNGFAVDVNSALAAGKRSNGRRGNK